MCGARAVHPHRLAHPTRHRSRRVRGDRRGRADQARPAVRTRGQRAAPFDTGRSPRCGRARVAAVARGERRRRHQCDGAQHTGEWAPGRCRDGAPDHRPRGHERRGVGSGRCVAGDHRRPGTAGRHAATREVHRIRLVVAAEPVGRPRSGRGCDRRSEARGLGRAGDRTATVPRRLLGRRGRGGRRRRSHPTGGALRPVPRVAGGRPRRATPHRREGPHRHRLRRPRLLGHRDVRARHAAAHVSGGIGRCAAVARAHAAGGARTRGQTGPRRRGLPVADDQRAGVLGLLAGRNCCVPRERRHRRRHAAPRRHHG